MSVNNNIAYSTITCDEDKLKIGNQFLAAFRNQDWVLLKSIITEDCKWTFPGQGELAGISEGAQQVIDKAKQFVVKLNLASDHIPVCLNCVAIAIHNQATAGDMEKAEHIATVNTIRDGRISGINTFFSDMPDMRKYFAELSL